MSVRTTLFIGASVIVMAVGVNKALLPDDPVQEHREQQTEQLSDSDGNVKEGYRDGGNAHGDAELAQKNVPVEPRPPEPKAPRVKLPFRIP